jgi:hypothetical protein
LIVDARGVGTFVLPEPLPFDPQRIEVARSGPTAPDPTNVLAASF